MRVRRFRSKVDAWLVVVLVAVVLVETLVAVRVLYADPRPGTIAATLGISAFICLFVGLTLSRTWYEVDASRVRIVCGLFHWSIARDEIVGVEETRSLLSSPALSLDRLRIRYGKNRAIMVSPVDKAGFRKAIGMAS